MAEPRTLQDPEVQGVIATLTWHFFHRVKLPPSLAYQVYVREEVVPAVEMALTGMIPKKGRLRPRRRPRKPLAKALRQALGGTP